MCNGILRIYNSLGLFPVLAISPAMSLGAVVDSVDRTFDLRLLFDRFDPSTVKAAVELPGSLFHFVVTAGTMHIVHKCES